MFEVQRTSEFDTWHAGLTDLVAQDAITDRIIRIDSGLLGDRRSVGDRVSELRINVGQGYRLYYTMRGQTVVHLLCGGTKKTQKRDIRKAEVMAKALGKTKKEPGDGRVRERQDAYAPESDEGEFHFTKEELRLSPFDAADYLKRESSQIYILRNAFASGHPAYIANAIGAVARARARGLTGLERKTGIKRQTLNKSLSLKGNPTLETMMTVLGALGLRLEIVEKASKTGADAVVDGAQ
jgi:putative addiction module killer protein/probable addiction module antidote protein